MTCKQSQHAFYSSNTVSRAGSAVLASELTQLLLRERHNAGEEGDLAENSISAHDQDPVIFIAMAE